MPPALIATGTESLHGCAPLEHADGFAKHLEKTGVEHSKNIPGNIGEFVRRDTPGGRKYFSYYLLTGSSIGEDVFWRILSRGGHLYG